MNNEQTHKEKNKITLVKMNIKNKRKKEKKLERKHTLVAKLKDSKDLKKKRI
jgi:hypothetical protein